MVKFVGVRHSRICVVSDNAFSNEGMEIIEVPKELSDIPALDFITKYSVINGVFICKKDSRHPKKIKLALVGNFKMRCGISTYSESLWPELVKLVENFKLFIEQNDISTGDVHLLGDQLISDEQISVCWKRGESLRDLVKALKEYDPDVILIQHEFGLWPNARYWLSMMNQLSDYRLIVTMHSVFHHRDKTIVEAAMPEIIVHLDAAKQVLKEEKQISSIVHVVTHGCLPFSDERLWDFYKSNATFVQVGFGFRYKNWEQSIKAVSILKEKYNDVFFTGLFSESPYSKLDHQLYYNELMELVEELDVSENVGIIRGYQSDNVIDSYLRTNKAAIFPYTSTGLHECFGSSGSAPLAMTKNIPVITSSAHHFTSLPTIKCDSPEGIAEALDQLFSDSNKVKLQINKQNKYLTENSWENIAKKYVAIFENDITDKK